MKITLHNFGNFRLDGGSMFGPVPKKIWSKLVTPDEDNRILMASNTLLIEYDDKKIIIDAGVGIRGNDKFNKIYGVEKRKEIPTSFAEADGITDVIITHLHFDHVGGLSQSKNSAILPHYPNARYHLQEANLKVAKAPNPQEAGSYFTENIKILTEDNCQLYNGNNEIFPKIKATVSNGHTTGLQYLLIEYNEQTIAFPSDLVPTSKHINTVYHMGFDINAELLLKEKQDFLEAAVKNNYLVVFQHDPLVPLGRISKLADYKFKLTPVDKL